MLQSKPQQFCFLEVKGPKGRTDPALKRLKNRNAQPRLRSKVALGTTRPRGQEALPVQIKFRLATDTTTPPCRLGEYRRCAFCGRTVISSARTAEHLIAHGSGDVQVWGGCGECAPRALTADGPDEQVMSALIPYQNACLYFKSSSCAGAALQKRDATAISYFRTHGAIDLSGYLPGHFWDRLVLQVSHSETIVRQSVIALGNAHLDHCTSTTVSESTLADHAAALSTLRKYMAGNNSPSHELVLLCSIIFFAFSRVLGDFEAAFIHLQTGIAILRDARNRLASTSTVAVQGDKDVIHDLTVMFVQLDIEATMQNIDRGPSLVVAHDDIGAQCLKSDWVPSADITSPHNSMESWMYICHEMWRFISCNARYRHIPFNQVPLVVIEQWQSIKKSIKIWRKATKEYLIRHPAIHRGSKTRTSQLKLEPEQILDAIRALIIDSHYFSCKRFIAESLKDPKNLKPFDKHPEALLEAAETVVALRREYHGMKDIHRKKTFSTHVGIVEALSLLVHRTSYPHIRARAQNIIEQLQEVQKGLSGLAAFFAGYGAPPSDYELIYEMPGH